MTVPVDFVVETLNVIKHIQRGVVLGGVDALFDSFILQAAEERLGNRIDVPNSSLSSPCWAPNSVHAPAAEILLPVWLRWLQCIILGVLSPLCHTAVTTASRPNFVATVEFIDDPTIARE